MESSTAEINTSPVTICCRKGLTPAFEVTHGDRNDLFNRLRARVALEHSAVTREIVSRAFDENDLLFIREILAALPGLTEEDLHWRFHFLVGAMIYTMSDSGQLDGLSGGKCSARQTDIALERLVGDFVALFEGAPTLSRARKSRLEADVVKVEN